MQRRCAGGQQKVRGNLQRGSRLGRLLTIFPVRILANSVNDHFSPHAVTRRNLYRQAGKRHKRIDRIGIILTRQLV